MPGAVLYPFAVSTLPWESLPGQWNLTVGLKATYTLAPSPGEPALSSQIDGLHEDVLFDQSPRASLYSPSDFVPFKARADVLLVGQAHAPGGVPTDSLLVRLRLGNLSKTLRVTGDRAWVDTPQGPRPSAPRPFTSAPLRYERASRKGENLAGVPPGDPSRPPAAIDLAPEEGAAETPGFGPIAASWRASRDPRLQDVLIWSQRLRTAPHQGPPPAGADPFIFNSAPRDQQLPEIAPGAPLVLDNLHPRIPRLETRIPAVVPRVFHVDPATGTPRELPVRIDTVWIDTDREVFVVSWRGFTPVAPPKEADPGRVLVAADARGQTATFEEIDALVRAGSAAPAPAAPTPTPRRPAPKTAALRQVTEAPVAPFPIAAPAATPAPDAAAAPIAGAPWAGVPAAPVPRPGKHLESTLPIGATIDRFRARPGEGPTKRKAPGTMAMPRITGPAAPAPFPLATPGAAAPAAPVEGAPWTGLPAAPVPKPDKHLEGTMPLGSSLADALAKAKGLVASTPAPSPVVAPPPAMAPPPVMAPPAVPVEPPPAPAPRPPSVAPPPPPPAPVPAASSAQPVWRVDEPPPPPAPPAPKPGPDVRQEVYGAFARKKK